MIKERFEKKFIRDPTTNCWNWLASTCRGYGWFRIGSKMKRANRVSYQLYTGIDPGEHHVLHLCDNPSCVNPEHLVLGTHKDNMIDRAAKGRHNNKPKLSKEQIECIKLDTRPQRVIAKDYGVSGTTIWFAKNS